jgi:hypothetical protein
MIRQAEPHDLPAVLALLRGLAREADAVVNAPDKLL